MLHRVRSLSIAIGALAFVALPIAAQSDGWTAYLSGAMRDEARAAVRVVDQSIEEATRGHASRYEALEGLYVSARDSALAHAEYREELRRIGAGESLQDGPGHDARRTIASIFRAQPPLPGTPAATAALAWLGELAESESFPVTAFRAIVRSVEQTHLRPITAADAARFSELMTVAHAGSRGSLSPSERAREDFATWTMGVLAAEPDDRTGLVESLGHALERWSSAETRGTRDLIDLFVRSELDRAALRVALDPPVAAIAAVRPHLFADAARHAGAHADVRTLGELLTTLTQTDPETVLRLDSPELAFLIDTTDALLSSSSDLQRFMLARAMGLTRHDLQTIHTRLYFLRVRAARLPRELDGLSAGPAAAGSEYQRFLAEGRALVAAAREWADGERSRSGEAYRWAMLPIVSHPYSQFLIATDPALETTAAMIDAFVSRTYASAFRRAGSAASAALPITVGDGVLPFHRVYRVPDRDASRALYEAFTAEAMGIADLSREFLRDHAAGMTMAAYWSHLHGLHLVHAPDDGPGARVRSRIDDWFALARVADTAPEEVSLLVRGLLALRRGILDEIRSVGMSGASPSIAIGAPRLAAALVLLEETAAFEADPITVMELLGLLYDSRTIDEAAARIALDLDRIVRRERDVVIEDRRILAAATEVRP